MTRSSLAWAVVLVGLLDWSSPAIAQDARAAAGTSQGDPLCSDPNDPGNLLRDIDRQDAEKKALFEVSPLGGLRIRTTRAKEALYNAFGIRTGLAFNSAGQALSNALPRAARSGVATDNDFVAKWELLNKGKPTHGGVYFQLEGRWEYDTTGPQTLGFESLASAIGTANTYSAYNPTYLVRNLYWQQGSEEAGWAYRIGKITPDVLLDSSPNLAPTTTFLSKASTGPFANALPDSGLGILAAVFLTDRIALSGLVSDANANRFSWGDIGAGDFYTAGELRVTFFPNDPKVGGTKITLWHNDGTKGGIPLNGSTGREGWGVFAKHEHSLSSDGKTVGIVKGGYGFNESSFYEKQVGAYLLRYDPPAPIAVQDDLFGVGFNWAKPPQVGTRDEYSVEVFYRFPVFPVVDATLAYQAVINPARTTEIDNASAFSLRLRTTF